MSLCNEQTLGVAILTSVVINALNSLSGDTSKNVDPKNLLPYPQLEKLKNPYLKIVSKKTRMWIVKAHELGVIPPNIERVLMQNSELWDAIFFDF